MLVLIQLIKLAKQENQLAAFYKLIEDLHYQVKNQYIDSIEAAETIAITMGVELSPVQVERLAEIVYNGSWKQWIMEISL